MANIPTRPTSVTVIGWLFIIVSVLMIFSALTSLQIIPLMNQVPNFQTSLQELPTPLKVILQSLQLITLIQLVIAILTLITAINFLKLKSWARTVLEIISWLTLIITLLAGIFFLILILTLSAQWTSSAILIITSTLIIAAAIISPTIPAIIILKFLRGKTIKSAVRF